MAKLQPRYAGKDKRGRPRLKGYYGVFYDPTRQPTRKEVPLGSKDESAARARLVRLERQYANGEYDPWTDKPDGTASTGIEEAVARFMASREETGSPAGVATYRAVLDPFVRSLSPALLLTQLEERHVSAWLASRSVKPSTLKGYHQRLGIFARWCVSEKLAPASWNPIPGTPRGKRARQETAPKFFTDGEMQALVRTIEAALVLRGATASHVDAMLPGLIAFTAGTGLRRGEVCALRWGAVHLGREGEAYVRVVNADDFTTKSGRERTVPLVGEALRAIEARAAQRRSESASEFVFPGAGSERLNGPYLSKRFRAYVRAAGLREADHHNFHSLRHTFGTRAVTRGVDVYRLKEIMGHARIETTLQYARLRPVTLFSEMQRAFGALENQSAAAVPIAA